MDLQERIQRTHLFKIIQMDKVEGQTNMPLCSHCTLEQQRNFLHLFDGNILSKHMRVVLDGSHTVCVFKF